LTRPVQAALNGRFSGTPQPTGTQTAAFQLFDAIIRARREIEIVVFADPRFPGIEEWKEVPGTRFVAVPFQSWSRGRAQLWEQFRLPQLCRQWTCKLAHHPISTNPVWHPGCKSVVTLHDLNFHLHPEWFTRSFRLVQNFSVMRGSKRAERVVAISNHVFDQAKKLLGIAGENLRMVYNGIKPLKSNARDTPAAGRRLLCVGSLQPHKNLSRLIRAYQRLQAEFPDLELHVVGRPQPRFAKDPELPGLLESQGVKLLGYLPEDALADAYFNCSVFCYPSLDEGFGLPVLEAMSAGAIVVTSNIACLQEIAGGKAILVDPFSIESMAKGLRQALTLDSATRTEMTAKGRDWARQFSWQRAADEYLKIYSELVL
jgi:glycosyltransferase involved in cell wall biosynthesis